MNKRLRNICGRLVGWQVLALLLTLLYSWVGSLYGLSIQNLLANEGVRWMLRNAMANYATMPVLSLMLLLMGWGILSASGWLGVCRLLLGGRMKELTPRQRWGFQVSLIALAAYLLLLSFGFWGDEPVLLSITGELPQSPLQDGAPVVILLGVLLFSGTYAWVSGRFRCYADFISSVTKGVADWSILFVNLFLLGQQLEFFRFVFDLG